MVQGGGRAGFAAKSFKGLRVLCQILRQKLQSDEAAQLGVFRFVDHAHPTTAEFLDNAVMRDSLTNERVSAGHVQHMLGGSRRQVNEQEQIVRDVRFGDLNEAALRRTLRVRRAEQWLLVG